MEEKIKTLIVGKNYNINIVKHEEKEDTKAGLECMRLSSRQEWYDGSILYRFESMLNSTALVINAKGEILGVELKDFEISDITESEPYIVKHFTMKESDLNNKIKESFSESEKVFEFIKTL